MGKLLFIFILLSIGTLIQFFFFDKQLHSSQLITLILFPLGAVVIWFIQRLKWKRDQGFIPAKGSIGWSTHLSERYSTRPKKLYLGNQMLATYRRFYPKWWQQVVNEVIEGEGNWYLNTRFVWEDGIKYEFHLVPSPLTQLNETWMILENGEVVGQIKTDFSMKNSVKLKEQMMLDWKGQAYFYHSNSLLSATTVHFGDQEIAKGKRSDVFRSQYSFVVNQENHEVERILVMTYVLFNFVHNQ